MEGAERDMRGGDATEEDEEVPPPIASLCDLEEAAMDGGREGRGSEPWTYIAVGEVAWWAGAAAAVAMNVRRTCRNGVHLFVSCD